MGGLSRSGVARRRVAAILAAVAVASATAIAVAPERAEAVRAVPWRFTSVTQPAYLGGAGQAQDVGAWILQCPAGYTAVSGGISAADPVDNSDPSVFRTLEYPNPATGAYHIAARNASFTGTEVDLSATCVWLDDVGTITTVFGEFSRNGSGRAGGIVRCPAGTSVLSGGVDWSNTSARRTIDFTSPITDGTNLFTGWYAAGYNDVSGVLAVELRCVSTALLAGAFATANDSTDPAPGYGDAQTSCGLGYRVLTGGAAPVSPNPGVFQGRSVASGPSGPGGWYAEAYQMPGVTLRALALCVPASRVSVTFTQRPPALSTTRTGTITFVATDSVGEDVSVTCTLDGAPKACASGTPVTYGPLLDGPHRLTVRARNQSGHDIEFNFNWAIDATAPVIASSMPASAAPVTGPFTITFSEPVSDVTTSSLYVRAEAANTEVSGRIARPTTTTATWTPTAPLVPGETYRIFLTDAIRDGAGNPLTATFRTVRATTIVENPSPAIQRRWDVDNAAVANGGAFIVSRQNGSKADLTFSATAGQTVSVFGIRTPAGGNADIYVDGAKKATASFYAASTQRVLVFQSAALSAGRHTISIRPLGTKPAASTNSWVSIDNVTVGTTVRQETALVQNFLRVSDAGAFGGSYDTMVQAPAGDTTPAQVRLRFAGNAVTVYATKTPTSGQARIYVDGILRSTVNLNAATTAHKVAVFTTALTNGIHDLRIEAVGTANGTNSAVNLDRITIG